MSRLPVYVLAASFSTERRASYYERSAQIGLSPPRYSNIGLPGSGSYFALRTTKHEGLHRPMASPTNLKHSSVSPSAKSIAGSSSPPLDVTLQWLEPPGSYPSSSTMHLLVSPLAVLARNARRGRDGPIRYRTTTSEPISRLPSLADFKALSSPACTRGFLSLLRRPNDGRRFARVGDAALICVLLIMPLTIDSASDRISAVIDISMRVNGDPRHLARHLRGQLRFRWAADAMRVVSPAAGIAPSPSIGGTSPARSEWRVPHDVASAPATADSTTWSSTESQDDGLRAKTAPSKTLLRAHVPSHSCLHASHAHAERRGSRSVLAPRASSPLDNIALRMQDKIVFRLVRRTRLNEKEIICGEMHSLKPDFAITHPAWVLSEHLSTASAQSRGTGRRLPRRDVQHRSSAAHALSAGWDVFEPLSSVFLIFHVTPALRLRIARANAGICAADPRTLLVCFLPDLAHARLHQISPSLCLAQRVLDHPFNRLPVYLLPRSGFSERQGIPRVQVGSGTGYLGPILHTSIRDGQWVHYLQAPTIWAFAQLPIRKSNFLIGNDKSHRGCRILVVADRGAALSSHRGNGVALKYQSTDIFAPRVSNGISPVGSSPPKQNALAELAAFRPILPSDDSANINDCSLVLIHARFEIVLGLAAYGHSYNIAPEAAIKTSRSLNMCPLIGVSQRRLLGDAGWHVHQSVREPE
ncbi:hypothetical protein K438DRAFT_1990352 [Mycena galopus ATCC 62051]|nr:hypothetical protein K438DRAFT_1990352 [Mycena galopus ATCC 62051]